MSGPKNVFIFGSKYTYIVRPDWDCYIKIENLKTGRYSVSGPAFWPLELDDSYTKSKHFCGVYHIQHEGIVADQEHEYVYVIDTTGTKFIKVKSMKKLQAVQGTLQPPQWEELDDACRGDFILATATYKPTDDPAAPTSQRELNFIVINKANWTLKFLTYKNLTEKPVKVEAANLNTKCQGGEYYWATQNWSSGKTRYYILKKNDKGRYFVHRTNNLVTDDGGEEFILPKSIVQLLPGCISFNLKAEWDEIQNLTENPCLNDQTKIEITANAKYGFNSDGFPQVAAVTHANEINLVLKEWIREFKYSFCPGSHNKLFRAIVQQVVHEKYKQIELDDLSDTMVTHTLPQSLSKRIHLWQQSIKISLIQAEKDSDSKYVIVFYTSHFMTTTTQAPKPTHGDETLEIA